jgi:hypothetical protein
MTKEAQMNPNKLHPDSAIVECDAIRVDLARQVAELKRDKAELVSAIRKAHEHVAELRDAWQRGAIDECDSKGGTRSNRNADVEVLLRAALAKHK